MDSEYGFFERGRDERSRMIDAQAQRITKLNEAMRDMKRTHDAEIVRLTRELNQLRPYAHCYKTLQETLLKYPVLLEEWQRFCVILKLCDPDEKKYQDHVFPY